jgi:hypothetical protein
MDKLSLADRVIRQLLSENEELLTSLLVLQVQYYKIFLIINAK